MLKTNLPLQQIKQDILSDNQEVRGLVMQDLLRQVRANPGIHESALAIFRRYLETEHDAWTSITAARGIEHIVGRDQARSTWVGLLNASREDLVCGVALSFDDPSFFPALMVTLRRRPEPRIRGAVMRTLGRLRNSDALPAIIEYLADPALRPDAIEALADLGDPRAIPHLEPLLSDMVEWWQRDERGAVLHMCDLAGMAIRRLQRSAESNAGALNASTINPTAAANAPIIPILLYSDSPPCSSVHSQERPIRAQSRFQPICLVPIAAAIIEVPWVAALLFFQLVRTGTIARNHQQIQVLDVIAMLPAAAGLVLGIIIATRPSRPRGWAERIYLIVGCLACAFILFCFGWEFFHP